MVTWAVTSGFDFEWVINLDLTSFESLIGSLERQSNAEMLRSIFVARVAQAEEKDYKKAVRELQKGSSHGPDDDSQRVKADLGRGI